jgi:3-hydroxybutyryl-CoA dehydrogenase
MRGCETICSATFIGSACKPGISQPIGPFDCQDGARTSLLLSGREILHHVGGACSEPWPLLPRLAVAGSNGSKAGRGWRRYDKDGKRL